MVLDCVFKVYPRGKYDALNLLNEKLERLNRTKATIGRRNHKDPSEAREEASLETLLVLLLPFFLLLLLKFINIL